MFRPPALTVEGQLDDLGDHGDASIGVELAELGEAVGVLAKPGDSAIHVAGIDRFGRRGTDVLADLRIDLVEPALQRKLDVDQCAHDFTDLANPSALAVAW